MLAMQGLRAVRDVPPGTSGPVRGTEARGGLRPLPRPRWVRWYVIGLVAAELIAAGVLTVLAPLPAVGPAGAVFFLAWPMLLAASGAYDERVFGAGSEEYRRVGRAGLLAGAGTALLSAAAAVAVPPALVLVVVPLQVVCTVLVRYVARQRLATVRRAGRCGRRVVLVGRGGAVLDLAARLAEETHTGLRVVAVCVTPEDRARVALRTGLPVGGLEEVADVAARCAADTVAVTSSSETAADFLRRLAWSLEGSGRELLVAPGLVEVAGPRLHIRPFEGLPLLSIEEPRFEGWQRVVKGALDRIAAAVALLLLSPVLLGIALAVRLEDGGPVIYRQERVGVHGRSFTMLKFRSMCADADQRLEEVLGENISDGPLFKVRHDPRVTRVGRVLRQFSLDELPQLVNVLTGAMSLVGPRPPLPAEVASYDDSVRRRLLVKPGLTGLWQISGRSDLQWEQAVRLDLRYVENWSLATDLLILWRTGRAVLGRSGAY